VDDTMVVVELLNQAAGRPYYRNQPDFLVLFGNDRPLMYNAWQ
jgi:hypothetical protein